MAATGILPSQYYPPVSPLATQDGPVRSMGAEQIGVQSYLPFADRQSLQKSDQHELADAMNRFLPRRLFRPSFLTPIPDLLANPGGMATLAGAVTGSVATALTYVYTRHVQHLSGKAVAGLTLAAGTVMGLASGVGTYFNRRAYNEDLVDAYMRGARTYREVKADPVWQAEENRAAMAAANRGNELINGLYLASAFSSMGNSGGGYRSRSSNT